MDTCGFVRSWKRHGDRFPRCRSGAVGAGRRHLHDLHTPQDPPMNILYILAALIAFALAIYLTIALLKPEWFE
jgi:K+-transporting ATPase KdpF subunit